MNQLAKNKKVFVAMSGGVDSSVSAALLLDQGYDVVGVHMRCFNVDGCAENDAEDARRVAESLNIPFYVFDFENEYKERVVDYMVQGYKKGITPNPDVMCNKEIKFGLFLEKALSMGADYVATGHYVRLRDGSLFIPKDSNKDQSYFLWTLNRGKLDRCLFPLGNYTKPEVRKIAKSYKLHNFDKKDSQGICFLGRVRLQDFLGNYIRPKAGKIKLLVGGEYRIIGEHRGAYNYTIGQRRIGVANKIAKGIDPKPLYVMDKDIKQNTVVVAEEGSPGLFREEVKLTDINFTNQKKNVKSQKVFARIRYRQPLFEAVLGGNKLIFKNPQKFIASGQSAVFYTKLGEMLGGGVIL